MADNRRIDKEKRMTRKLLVITALVAMATMGTIAYENTAAATSSGPTCILANGDEVARGFDDLGYNRCAGIFNGDADGTDGAMDDTVWGDPTYASDHLNMKWNRSWDACNADRNAENCAGAWLTNEWNGMKSGGSGETWHYKIVWVGSCGPSGSPLPDGGYCIWNEYALVLSHGTVANQHFWDTHARPNGFGSF
jgi:hypothetical protein